MPQFFPGELKRSRLCWLDEWWGTWGVCFSQQVPCVCVALLWCGRARCRALHNDASVGGTAGERSFLAPLRLCAV
jgi:hypothetical protein